MCWDWKVVQPVKAVQGGKLLAKTSNGLVWPRKVAVKCNSVVVPTCSNPQHNGML